jgi:hypothetical protein
MNVVWSLLAEKRKQVEEDRDDVHVNDEGANDVVIEAESPLALANNELSVVDQEHA